MTLTTHTDLVQGSDEWLQARLGLVTASVVGQLLSVSAPGASAYDCPDCDAAPGDPCVSKVRKADQPPAPIKTMHPARVSVASDRAATAPKIVTPASGETARSLTLLLVSERITGHVEDTFVSDDMLRGQLDEPLARAYYSKAHAPVTEVGLMVDDRWGFKIGYSPDGLVGDDGLIEVKSRKPKKQLATILAGEPPADTLAQMQAGMLVSGRSWCDYISWCGGMPPFVTRVHADPAWAEAIVEAVATFEYAAAQMTGTYLERTDGIPVAERVDHFAPIEF